MMNASVDTGDPLLKDENKEVEEQQNPFLETTDEPIDPSVRPEDSGETGKFEGSLQKNPLEENNAQMSTSEILTLSNSSMHERIQSPENDSWDTSKRNIEVDDMHEENLVEVYLNRRQLSIYNTTDSVGEDQVQRFESLKPTAREDFLLNHEDTVVVVQGQDFQEHQEALYPVTDPEYDLDDKKIQARRRLTLDVELLELKLNPADTKKHNLSSRNHILEDEVFKSSSELVSQGSKSEGVGNDSQRSTSAPSVKQEKDMVKAESKDEKLNYLSMFEEEMEKQNKREETKIITSRDPPNLELQAQLPAEDIIEKFDVLPPPKPNKLAIPKEKEHDEDVDISEELIRSLRGPEDSSTPTGALLRGSKLDENTETSANAKKVLEKEMIPEPPAPSRNKRKELENRLQKAKELRNAKLGESEKSSALKKVAEAISYNETLMEMLFNKKQTESYSENELVEESPVPDTSIFRVLDKDFAQPQSSEPELSVSDRSFNIVKNVTHEDQSPETLSALENITKIVDALNEAKADKQRLVDKKLERYRANCMELIYYMIKKKLRMLREMQEIKVCRGLVITPEDCQLKIIKKQMDETERDMNQLREKLLAEPWWIEQMPSSSKESSSHEPSLNPKKMDQVFEPIASTFKSILSLNDQAKQLFTQKLEGLHSSIESKNLELQSAIIRISKLHDENWDEKADLEAQLFDLRSKLLEARGQSHGRTRGFVDPKTTRQLSKPEDDLESMIGELSNSNAFNEDDKRIRGQLSEKIIEVQRYKVVSQELRERLSELLKTVSEIQKQHPEIKFKELIPEDKNSLALLLSSDLENRNMSQDIPGTVTNSTQLLNVTLATSPKHFLPSPPKDESKAVLENQKEMSVSPKSSAPPSPTRIPTEGRARELLLQETEDRDVLDMDHSEDKPAEEEKSTDNEEEIQMRESQLEELRSKLHDARMSKLRLIEATSCEMNFLRKQIKDLRVDLNSQRMRKLEQVRRQSSSWFSSWWTQKTDKPPKPLPKKSIGFVDSMKDKSEQVVAFSDEIERLRDIIRVLSTKKGPRNIPVQLNHDFIKSGPSGGSAKYERDIADYTVDLP